MQKGADKARRRQARGQRRMAQLLDAAARVFCTVGYQSASTNSIAREAGVSPGTLYQFFPNKEAIGDALSERLAAEMREAHGAALSLEHASLNLGELLDQVIDPLIAFNLENPVCFTLLKRSDMPPRFSEDHHLLHTALLGQVKQLMATRAPHLERRALDLYTDICWSVVFGTLQTLFEKESDEERAALATELKKVLYGYLLPIMGEEAERPPAETTGADSLGRAFPGMTTRPPGEHTPPG